MPTPPRVIPHDGTSDAASPRRKPPRRARPQARDQSRGRAPGGLKRAREGVVYILLNPAFPRQLKIGCTRDSRERASALSRRTGVPQDYVLLFDALVSDPEGVEQLLHARFASYRSSRHKEFFTVPPKEAILALQQLAGRFSMHSPGQRQIANLLPYLCRAFPEHMDTCVTGLRLVQTPGQHLLEIDHGDDGTCRIPLVLPGLKAPRKPTRMTIATALDFLQTLPALTWAERTNVFRPNVLRQIRREHLAHRGTRPQREGSDGGGIR